MNPSIAIIGIPFDANASYLRGSALAPAHIRKAFHSPSANYGTEVGMDLSTSTDYHLLEDMEIGEEYDKISDEMSQLLEQYGRVISLGGDHSITFPIAKAVYQKFGAFNLLQFDAHTDLYDEFDGNRFSHGCPFARIMEVGYVKRLVQVGIRCLTPHQVSQAQKFGVEILEMKDFKGRIPQDWEGPLYLSLDLDVMDPAYVPRVSHHEPGGLTSREVINLIHQINVPLIGADIVELNPHRDQDGLTAMVAAKMLKEILGKMLY